MNNADTETRLKDELARVTSYRKEMEKRLLLKEQIRKERQLLDELNPSFFKRMLDKVRGDGLR